MPVGIAANMRQNAADGYYGKKDLQADAASMLDGRGITKVERRKFVDTFKKIVDDPKVRVTDTAQDAFDHLRSATRGYSRTKEIFAPNMDKGEIKDILSLYVDQSRSYGGGEYGGGSSSSASGSESGGGGYASGGGGYVSGGE